jgi:hypothetical protein
MNPGGACHPVDFKNACSPDMFKKHKIPQKEISSMTRGETEGKNLKATVGKQ